MIDQHGGNVRAKMTSTGWCNGGKNTNVGGVLNAN